MLDIVFNKNIEGSLKLNNINKCSNIFCFSLGLGAGDISNPLSDKRIESLKNIYDNLEYELNYIKRDQDRAKISLDSLFEEVKNNQMVRIWYSSEINEFCGMCWIINELSNRMTNLPIIKLVRLPDVVKTRDAIHIPQGWGEVAHEFVNDYLKLEEEANNGFITYAKMTWQALVMDDKPLRVMINGNVESVEQNFFDYFIIREIKTMHDTFNEANLIVRMITKYHFGLSDAFLAYRINELIKEGYLVVEKEADLNEPSYRRMLRRLK